MFTFLLNAVRQSLGFNSVSADIPAPVVTYVKEHIPTPVKKRIVFVDFDNVVHRKNRVGQTLIDNINAFFEHVAQMFKGEKVLFKLYGNQSYLQLDLSNLAADITFTDTPVLVAHNKKTATDSIILVDMMLEILNGTDKLALFSNDVDFAHLLSTLDFMGKDISLITNRMCNRNLLKSCRTTLDARPAMLAVGAPACSMIKGNYKYLLENKQPLKYYPTFNFCQIFSKDNWQGFGSFKALLEASFGKSCDFSQKGMIYVLN